eukprot:TRINITY_DN7314_c0_g1_i1.p1 TRINITY_DN7314_c0_g1~~TRINITY_DN7314_c0_g1_i1.p1  ORF type:complete len:438 (+),score=100.11 TRINITY_DN7314_c0_g1_i1:47-1360(+)
MATRNVRHTSLSDFNNNINKKPGYARHCSISDVPNKKTRNLSVTSTKDANGKENCSKPRHLSLRSVSDEHDNVQTRPRLQSKSEINVKDVRSSLGPLKSAGKASKIPISTVYKKSPEVPTRRNFTIHVPKVNLPENVVNIDIEDGMYEYSADLIAYLKQLELDTILPSNYLDGGSTQPRERALVVDWMIQVCNWFKFCQETLFYSISLLDTVISRRDIKGERLQLVAVSCIWIASKLEEYYPADLNKLAYLTKNSFTTRQIVKMEFIVLSVLNFKLHLPCIQTVLNRFVRAACRSNDLKFVKTCQYLIESHAVDVKFPTVRPSLQVAGGVLGAILLFHVQANQDIGNIDLSSLWNATLVYYTNYGEDEVLPVTLDILRTLTGENAGKYEGAYNKYLSESRHSKLVQQPHLSVHNLDLCQLVVEDKLGEKRGLALDMQ